MDYLVQANSKRRKTQGNAVELKVQPLDIKQKDGSQVFLIAFITPNTDATLDFEHKGAYGEYRGFKQQHQEVSDTILEANRLLHQDNQPKISPPPFWDEIQQRIKDNS